MEQVFTNIHHIAAKAIKPIESKQELKVTSRQYQARQPHGHDELEGTWHNSSPCVAHGRKRSMFGAPSHRHSLYKCLVALYTKQSTSSSARHPLQIPHMGSQTNGSKALCDHPKTWQQSHCLATNLNNGLGDGMTRMSVARDHVQWDSLETLRLQVLLSNKCALHRSP